MVLRAIVHLILPLVLPAFGMLFRMFALLLSALGRCFVCRGLEAASDPDFDYAFDSAPLDSAFESASVIVMCF